MPFGDTLAERMHRQARYGQGWHAPPSRPPAGLCTIAAPPSPARFRMRVQAHNVTKRSMARVQRRLPSSPSAPPVCQRPRCRLLRYRRSHHAAVALWARSGGRRCWVSEPSSSLGRCYDSVVSFLHQDQLPRPCSMANPCPKGSPRSSGTKRGPYILTFALVKAFPKAAPENPLSFPSRTPMLPALLAHTSLAPPPNYLPSRRLY